MKEKLLTALILLTPAFVPAQAQNPITVGILKFESHYVMLGRDVTSLVTADLSADPRLAFVERSQLQQVLNEEALGLSGTINPDSAAKIGQLTGAKVLVTGRVLMMHGQDVVILANIVGTENGRMFSEEVDGSRSNLVAMASELSGRIAQLITEQATNFMVKTITVREQQTAQIIGKIKGPKRPSVSLKFDEQLPGGPGAFQTTETELGVLLQKAGFSVVDEKSDAKPDVYLTGAAVSAITATNGGFFSAHATLEIKAQERSTGKILLFDRQENIAADVGQQMAARKALENATDELAARLLPLLTQ
jgi:TolB-like protein